MIQKLGKYKIIDKLGEGAMGDVYKACDSILDRNVAIKIMAEDIKWNPELKLRFYREAKAAASLHHPNIVTIYDLGEEGKTTYIVMEHLQGKNLKQVIQEAVPIPLEKKLLIIAQVADGLNHAHKGGFIHRDIKPGNIFITSLGAAKILDFGIVHISTSNLTRVGDRLGTPVYMSPELIRGEKFDARSDIFSTGIVFYEFLTYVHPFRDSTFDKTLNNIIGQETFRFSEQFPEAPAGLWPIISRCLEKKPDKRFESIAEAAIACRHLIDDLNLASQQMTKELTAILPTLRLESQRPNVPEKLTRLCEDTQALLNREQKPDYLSLLRLTTALSKERSLYAGAQPRVPSTPYRNERPPQADSVSQGSAERSSMPDGLEVPAKTPHSMDASSVLTADKPILEAEFHPPVVLETPSPTPTASEKPVEEDLREEQMMSEAEALLAEGRLDEALIRIRTIMGQLGPKEPLVQLLAETRRKIEERNRALISQFLDIAKESMEAREFHKAVDALDRVLELESDKANAIEMRRAAMAEIEAEKLRQARKEEGERGKTSGFKLLSEKKYRESLRLFKQAAGLLGDDATIKLGIEEAEEGIRVEELQAKVSSELAQAQKLFHSGDFVGARARANRALELSPRNAEARDLLVQIGQAQEEKNRRDAISSFIAQSQDAARRQNFDEALVLANEALQRDPANAQIHSLLQSINQAKEETHREQEAAELLEKAKDALSREVFDEADSQARAALAVIPENPNALEFLRKINQIRDEKRKAQEIERAYAEAEQAFQLGDLTQCEVRARQILAMDAKEGRANKLLERAAHIRAEKKREQINALIDQGYAALSAGDFPQAANFANEALRIEAQNVAAEKLLADIKQAEADRIHAKIEDLLSLSRESLNQEKFDIAANLANEVLTWNANHKEAKSLLKEIARSSRAGEKKLRKQQKEFEKTGDSTLPGDRTGERPGERPVAEDSTVLDTINPGGIGKMLVRIGIPLICAVILAGGGYYWLKHRNSPNSAQEKPIALAALIGDAKANLDNRNYDKAIEIAEKALASAPANSQAKGILFEAKNQKKASATELLMLEAQNLRTQNQHEASLAAIQKVLDIDPNYGPALDVRSQILAEQAEIASGQIKDENVRKYLRKAQSIIAACKTVEIKAEIDAIKSEQDKDIQQKRLDTARMRLDACKLTSARGELEKAKSTNSTSTGVINTDKQLTAKMLDFDHIQDDVSKLKETIAQKNDIEDFSKKAELSFKEAKYAECLDSLNRWLKLAPQNKQAQDLFSLASRARESLEAYNEAVTAKRHETASNALDRLEKIDPSNKDLAEYRRRVDTLRKSTKAYLTISRKNEPATLMLDDKAIGVNGEVENMVVNAGAHTITMKNSKGGQKSVPIDLFDGTNSAFSYNSATLEFEPLTEAGREAIKSRKEREKDAFFHIQHTHGMLRGNCSGDLLISGLRIEYKPDRENDHAFTHTFANLNMSLSGEKLQFTEVPSNKELGTFKVNASDAKKIKELWDKLQKLGK
jgi:serine/threonine protein kinase